jgi:hypothetical protein
MKRADKGQKDTDSDVYIYRGDPAVTTTRPGAYNIYYV